MFDVQYVNLYIVYTVICTLSILHALGHWCCILGNWNRGGYLNFLLSV